MVLRLFFFCCCCSVPFCSFHASCLDLFNAMNIFYFHRERFAIDKRKAAQICSAGSERETTKWDRLWCHIRCNIAYIAAAPHTAHIYRTCFMCGKIQFHVLCVANVGMVCAISLQIETLSHNSPLAQRQCAHHMEIQTRNSGKKAFLFAFRSRRTMHRRCRSWRMAATEHVQL